MASWSGPPRIEPFTIIAFPRSVLGQIGFDARWS